MELEKGKLSDRLKALEKFLEGLSEEEYLQIKETVVESTKVWEPVVGPQTEAYYSAADILFYGGQAGGGKTDLLIGLALTGPHASSIIFRRESKQMTAVLNRMTELLGNRDGYSGQSGQWKFPDRIIEFGSCKDVGDEIKYQGQPHALLGFDEITHFTEGQFRFLTGWNRTTVDGDVTRIVCTGNPPTDSDGEWVIRFWGPWLDDKHPNPAEPGELRYYVTFKDGVEREVDGPVAVQDPKTLEWIKPKSRTFIPSSVDDNPFLLKTGYKDMLYSLPEPLRSQMAEGSFKAGKDDDPWQVLPTSWVEAAMGRWVQLNPIPPMDSMGVDVARGGRDQTVISRRHGGWFDQLVAIPGNMTPNGQAVAALAVTYLKNAAPIHIDLIGVGSSAYDHLQENNLQVIGVNNANSSFKRDKTGTLKMRNKRSECYWELREALDPKSNSLIALPPDRELKADLCAPRWKLTGSGVLIESKDDIFKRLGRSTDRADAVVLAFIETEREDEDDDLYRVTDNRSLVTGY